MYVYLFPLFYYFSIFTILIGVLYFNNFFLFLFFIFYNNGKAIQIFGTQLLGRKAKLEQNKTNIELTTLKDNHYTHCLATLPIKTFNPIA